MNYLENFRLINTFIFDVDGVLTDSSILIMENGELLRRMNVRDGYALKLAVEAGYRVVIITGGRSSGVIKRLKKLGINDIFSGVDDKLNVYEDYVATHELDPQSILFMGDDLPDYLPMRKVGLPACPKDAVPELLNIAQYISPKKGGEGCVRDVIEKTMRLHNRWVSQSLPDFEKENL